MNREQEFFLQIMHDYIYNLKTEYQEVDFPSLCNMATSHQLSAILYYQCKDFVQCSFSFSTLQSSFTKQIFSFANRNRVIKQLKDALANIPFVLVKGAIIADLYPIPALRSMGDVDVIVHEDDIETVKLLLCEVGFVLEKESLDFDERHFSKCGINVEIHTGLVREDQADEKCKAFFDNVWKYIKGGTLDWNFHFLYLIAHLRSHFASHGVGFRQFLDVAIVTQKIELDWNWITEKAEEIGLLKFLKTVVSLNQRWFDAKSPLAMEITDEFYERATQDIFTNGVFGDMSVQKAPKQLIVNGNKGVIARTKYLLKQAFPPYERIVRLPYCSYVRRVKILLPIAWLHRGIYRFTNKERRENFMARTVSSKEEISRLENWGLI